MSSVDERVVKMSFDNAEFERKASGTMSTLDKLKQALNFKGAEKGFQDIQSSANNVKFDSLMSGINALSDRFSVIGEIAHNTFMNIANTAIDVGRKVAEALTIKPIEAGFKEYETQINAVQTILANTQDNLVSRGFTTEASRVDLVNAQLDELNRYADKTIYNFTEMTRNIGTFTAAGVDLETSTRAIEGIANLAAVSGSNSEQASRAMYQLSQALSSGSVKLQDWNSVVNAGMGGALFQKELVDTLSKRGGASAETASKIQSGATTFRDSLKSGWLTDDVLLETLEKFTAGTEGLTEAQIEQQKEMWKARGYTDEEIDSIFELGQMSIDAATKVKTFSQLIETLEEALQSGWTESWRTIIGDFGEAKELWTEVSDVLGGYIQKSADARNATLKAWAEGGGRADLIQSLRNGFEALVQVMTAVKGAWDSVFPPITAQTLLTFTSNLKNFTEGLKLSNAQTTVFQATMGMLFRALRDVVEGGVNLATNAFNILKTVIGSIASTIGVSFIGPLGMITTRFRDFTEAIKLNETQLSNIGRFVSGVTNLFKSFVEVLITAGSALFDNLGNALSSILPVGDGFLDMLGDIGDLLGEFGNAIHENLDDYDVWNDGLESIFDSLGKVWNAIKDFTGIDKITSKLRGFFDSFSSKQIDFNVFELIGKAFDKIKEFISFLGNQLSNSHIDLLQILGLGAGGITIKKVWDLVGKVGDAIEDMGGWKSNLLEIKDAIVDTFGTIQDNIKAGQLTKIATAIGILSASLFVISTIDIDKLVASLGAIHIMMMELDGLMKVMGDIKIEDAQGIGKLGISLIEFSVAIGILSAALKNLSGLDFASLTKGMIAITILIGEMTGVAYAFSKFEGDLAKGAGSLVLFASAIAILSIPVKQLGALDLVSLAKGIGGVTVLIAEMAIASKSLSGINVGAGAGFTLIAAGIVVMAQAVKQLGSLDLASLGKGLGSVAVMLAEVAVATNFFPDNMLSIGAGLVAISIGINLMAAAVAILGGLSLESLVQGLIGLGVALAELAIAANAMTGALPGAAAMLVMATSLVPLTAALMMLSLIPFDSLVISLIAIAGAFTILGLAAVVLTPLAPGMLAVAAAMAVFGVSAALFAAAITAIALAVSVSGSALLMFIEQLLLFIPQLGIMIAEMLVNFLTTIAENGAQIVEAVTQIITMILEAVNTNVPVIIETLMNFLSQLLEHLSTLIPQMAEMALQVILAILNTVSAHIGEIVQSAISIAVNFIDGIASMLGDIIDSAFNLVISFINGLADAIDANHGELFAAIGNLIRSIVEAIGDGIRDVVDKGKELVGDFIDGLTSGDILGRMAQAGIDLVNGFIDGIGSMVDNAIGAAASLASQTWGGICSALGINSPSKVAHEGGIWFIQGFVNGIDEMVSDTEKSATNIAATAMDALVQGMDDDLSPTIKPVVDLSDVRANSKEINSLFDSAPSTIGISANLSTQNAMMQDMMSMLGASNDYSSILSGISDLRKDLATYTNQLANLQVVMDSGTLVGAITPQMDSALGVRRMMAGRGVI